MEMQYNVRILVRILTNKWCFKRNRVVQVIPFLSYPLDFTGVSWTLPDTKMNDSTENTRLENYRYDNNSQLPDGTNETSSHSGTRRTPCDMNSLFWSYLKCVYRYWSKCLRLHPMPVTYIQQSALLLRGPCYHGNLHFPNHNFFLDLHVQRIFQINLTFTDFYLQHFTTGCIHHYIAVGILLNIINTDKGDQGVFRNGGPQPWLQTNQAG